MRLANFILSICVGLAGAVPMGWAASVADAPPAGNSSFYVAMPDGVRLAADLWMPPDYRPGQRVPVLLKMTRYWRAPALSLAGRLARGIGSGGPPQGPVTAYLNRHGYAVMVVDMRGSGASEGSRDIEFSPRERADESALASWAAGRSWSNGRVGAYGVSYEGNTAEWLAASGNPAVKAVAALYDDFDPELGLLAPGGLVNRRMIAGWSRLVAALDRNDVCGAAGASGFSCALAGMMATGVKPVSGEAAVLRHALATRHNLEIEQALAGVAYRDDVITAGARQYRFADISPYGAADRFLAAKVPMLVVAGWMDAATAAGALARYRTIDTPQEVWLGPWSHGGSFDTDTLRDGADTDFGGGSQAALITTFFDRFLKPGGDGRPVRAVHYQTMGDRRWHVTSVWPPAGQGDQRWRLAAQGRLAGGDLAGGGEDRLVADPAATTGPASRWDTNLGGGAVRYPGRDRLAGALTYVSAPLAADLTFTGSPVLSARLASDRPDGGLFVYLDSIDPQGHAHYLTEGVLRLADRALETGPPKYYVDGPVQRRFDRADARPMPRDRADDVMVAFYPVSARLPAGHRLRLAITMADAGHMATMPRTAGGTLRVTWGGTLSLPTDPAD